jgi:beta-galactosidase
VNWLEHVETDLPPRLSTLSGKGVWYQSDHVHYLAAWPEPDLLHVILHKLAGECGLPVVALPEGIRLRRRGRVQLALNYGPSETNIAELVPGGASLLLGSFELPPAGVAAWTIS